MGTDRVIPVIGAALNDPDLLVRKNAVSALGKSGNALAVAELAKFLTAPELRKYASGALHSLGHSHLPLLHAMAGSTEPSHIRQSVIAIIGKFGDEKSMKTLVNLVKNDPVDEIRTAASYALVLGGGPHRG